LPAVDVGDRFQVEGRRYSPASTGERRIRVAAVVEIDAVTAFRNAEGRPSRSRITIQHRRSNPASLEQWRALRAEDGLVEGRHSDRGSRSSATSRGIYFRHMDATFRGWSTTGASTVIGF
jgi:hypothetical protein